MDLLFQTYLSLFLALIIGSAAFHKFTNPSKVAELMTSYGFKGSVLWVKFIATIETIIALLLVYSSLVLSNLFIGAIAATLLFLSYGAVMARVIREGRHIADCGCGWGGQEVPVSISLVVRNILLSLVALATLIPAQPRVLSLFDHLNGALFVSFLLISYHFFEIWTAVDHTAKVRRVK